MYVCIYLCVLSQQPCDLQANQSWVSQKPSPIRVTFLFQASFNRKFGRVQKESRQGDARIFRQVSARRRWHALPSLAKPCQLCQAVLCVSERFEAPSARIAHQCFAIVLGSAWKHAAVLGSAWRHSGALGKAGQGLQAKTLSLQGPSSFAPGNLQHKTQGKSRLRLGSISHEPR